MVKNNKCSSIYIHIPFCIKKCSYCDFLSYSTSEDEKIKYMRYLQKEIENYKELEYDTVYIGGGTPSVIDEEEIEKILKKLKILKNAEVTIEVNPGTVNFEKLKKYKEMGINRISMGCQSFEDEMLKVTGRIHTAEEALKCYEDIRMAGFTNINIDLMFALPGQTVEMVKNSLEIACKLNPEHISIYSLIWEDGTELDKRRIKKEVEPKKEEEEAEMYEIIIEYLTVKGYNHYEISNFSKIGFESKHNLKCWRNEEYIGAGVGASGYIDKIRYKNQDTLENYYKSVENKEFMHMEEEVIEKKEEEEYKYILGFRKIIEGVKVTGEKNISIAEKLCRQELLEKIENGNYRVTKRGIFTANYIFEEFL
jgi:oxygen-independent coproporphyrinogen III oxidase